jgi:hypothetical protein
MHYSFSPTPEPVLDAGWQNAILADDILRSIYALYTRGLHAQNRIAGGK